METYDGLDTLFDKIGGRKEAINNDGAFRKLKEFIREKEGVFKADQTELDGTLFLPADAYESINENAVWRDLLKYTMIQRKDATREYNDSFER
jgi:hypothetical protein